MYVINPKFKKYVLGILWMEYSYALALLWPLFQAMILRCYKAILVIILLVPSVGICQQLALNDSIKILQKDTLAYQQFLTRPDSAIRLAKETLDSATRYKHAYLQGVSHYILSKAYWAKANFKLSADFGFKALQVFENSAHIELWGKTLLSLARTFIDLQNNEQGKQYVERAITLAKLHNDERLLADAFREKSMLLSQVKQYDSANYFCDLGIPLYDKFKDSVNLGILYSRKAKISFYQNDYKQSSYYNRKALLFETLVGNKRALGITYYQLALDEIHLNNLDTAITLLSTSIPINSEMRNFTLLVKVHTLLADIYSKQLKSDLAVKQLKVASAYKDSLFNSEKSGQIQEMQLLYELSDKERRITMLEKENFLKQQEVKNQRLVVAILLLCVLFLAMVVYFLTHFRKIQNKTNQHLSAKNRAIEQQKEEIQAQTEVLQDLNQLKSKLFSVISHDLRGPIATLHALLDLLSKKQLSAVEFVTISDKLKSNLDVTQRTLENLLNWSMSQMEGIKTESKTIDINHTINEACNLMGEAAQQKNVLIENNQASKLYVRADDDQLHLILRNLIHNAIKFSKPYDKISVNASQHSDFCFVTVKDSGIGMSKTEIDTVVGSNNHFSKIGTMQEKGTGLGLLLCKEFIKLNGGDLEIRSAINKGTEVIFTIPLAMN
jgi:signal transduction histidine kinase